MSRIRRALFVQFFASNGATAVHFVISIILARMLSPHDIGVFSITVVVTNIAHIFRDFGVTSFLRTVKECTPERIRAANGLLMTSSWTMALFLFLISGPVASYYMETGVRDAMQVLSAGFLFIPFGAIPLALLARELKAECAAWISVFSVTSYAVSVLTLAYLDFGYMSMAWANLVNIVTTGLGATFFRPRNTPWLPSFKGWKQVMNFGAGAIVGNSMAALNNALPDVILGKVSGPHDVGILSRANSTTNIFLQVAGPAVNYAALPHLAGIHHRGECLGRTVKNATEYLTAIAWPALACTAVFANEIILSLYGQDWLECTPIVRVLCICAAVGMLTNFDTPALLAINRPYLSAITEFSLLCVRALAIFVLYDGSLLSFASALAAATVLCYPVHLFLQRKFFNIRCNDLAYAVSKSLFIAIACGLASLLLIQLLPFSVHPGITLLTALLAIPMLWLIALKLLDHPLYAEILPFVGKLRRAS